jgi:hypothetical protein
MTQFNKVFLQLGGAAHAFCSQVALGASTALASEIKAWLGCVDVESVQWHAVIQTSVMNAASSYSVSSPAVTVLSLNSPGSQ